MFLPESSFSQFFDLEVFDHCPDVILFVFIGTLLLGRSELVMGVGIFVLDVRVPADA